ncbi:hypothetical protein ABID22_001186 [Pontibacter aydingkolensis]|uniref:SpoIIAA-like n=1 Tax=Pontibacter aydingkolensis TaxID=1911536 RepID=A0ABS7CTC6_9BACT|nr:hypothetical protein [Pontibacter aydingkolensis]MBW7467094.1 hypothetical protein [Pontibacter aydingkolensis]
MLIPNKFIKLEYDPAKDVLYFQWPDFYEYAVPELKYILKSVTDTIKSYDIKYLIIDATKSVISISDPLYVEVATQFNIDLKSTRLKRSARIVNDLTVRETQIKEIREKAGFSLEVKSFKKADEALEWFSLTDAMAL